MTRFLGQRFLTGLDLRGLAKYALELAVIAAIYFVLAKTYPSTIPAWPPTGFALAAVVLRGLRVWPAIFSGALAAGTLTDVAGVTFGRSFPTLLAIAVGNTLEAVLGGYLINVWCDGRRVFDTPARVAKFALVSLGPSTMLGAAIGVGSLCVAGYAAGASFVDLWVTWWLRHAAGALVVAPAVVLWTIDHFRVLDRDKILASATAFLAAGATGFFVFSPLVEFTVNRNALSALAVASLLWVGRRCGSRDAATCTLILSGFAVWNALTAGAPPATTPNEFFLMPIIFMISISILGLALSADEAERQRFEARLCQQEQNLRAMFSQAVVGVAQIDTRGQCKLVNGQFCELVRRPAAELLRMQIRDLIDPDDLSRMVDLLEHAVRTGEGFAIEARAVLPDGMRRWIRSNVAAMPDPRGAVHHLMVVAEDITTRRNAEEDLVKTIHDREATLTNTSKVLHSEIEQRKRVEEALRRDITERRKTEEALMESEWRFRMLVQGVTDYAIYMLDRDGCITNWNAGAQRIHQYTAGEIVGQHFGRVYSEEEQQGGEPTRALQVAAYEGKYAVEGWRMRRDESQFWASVVIEAVRDEAGTLVGFVKITRDITERREAQASLERAQEQLAQSQKMEALGQLTGSIAHDFNNLLMIVSGHAQLLRRRLTDPKQLQAIDAVHTAANRGESLTRQLLAFSRRQPINPVVTDLRERIEAVHEMLVGSLRGNVQLKCGIAADIWPVEVDIAELELALVNIAVNARDAMPGGGMLTLSALNVTLKKADQVDRLEGDFVALAMTDTGVGIAPDVLPKIFEPFFTTKALGKGTGLGLAQVYGFSHLSGGTVVATSTVGSGTAITIYLPRKHATVGKAVEAPATQPIVLGRGTILVVEDNAEVADVTASLVEQLGYQTLRAGNAMDALNKLQRSDRIILVFSDIVMPGSMNGIALAQEVGNRYPQIPVLLTSGYSDLVQTAASQFRILRKPFQLSALEKSIREALEHATTREDGNRVLEFPRGRATI